MRRPSLFKQSDVARALKGAATAGLRVARVEIHAEGRIVLVSGKSEGPEPDAADAALELWRRKRGARPA